MVSFETVMGSPCQSYKPVNVSTVLRALLFLTVHVVSNFTSKPDQSAWPVFVRPSTADNLGV
ncbi:hypothetical protein A3K89_00775 [Rhodococcoides kyotonense]|uniref:Uncharacterized protein n=1 Tax=Rhodococcoides kyotonense TaxID=398843 RepID=A0A177YPS0_9NOCA|nr:hypothetical protein A3K89_00775 [Rhodococcus kyotonensis]